MQESEDVIQDSSPEILENSDVNSEDSSPTDNKGVKSESLFDVVKKSASEAKSEEETQEESPPSEGLEKDENSSEPDAETEDDKDPPFHEHPRWKEVLAERDDAKTQVEQFKVKADYFDELDQFAVTNNLSNEDFSEALQIAAAFKRNPTEGLQMLKPLIQQAQELAGEVLPDDLNKKIQDGFLDEGSAKELAQQRAKNQFLQDQMEQQEQVRVQQDQQQLALQQQNFQRSMATAVSTWEENWQKSDPDYKMKAEPVLRYYRAEVATNPPKSVEEAISLVEKAKADVEKDLGIFKPKKQPVNHLSGGASVSQPTSKPKSLNDAIRGALSR